MSDSEPLPKTSAHRPKAAEMNAIARIHPDATVTWDEPVPHTAHLVESCGDVVLDTYDLWDPQRRFYNSDFLERWAEGWSFSLAGIDAPEAMRKMLLAFTLPVMQELHPGGDEAFDRLPRDTVYDAPDDLDLLFHFLVRVDGDLVRRFLVDQYDGPLESIDDQVAAVNRRSTDR
jgi:hypothetical protein